MVKSLSRSFEAIILIAFLTGASLFALYYMNIKPNFKLNSSIPSSLQTPSPSPQSLSMVSEFVSPDGRSTLLVDKKEELENISYSFTIVDEDGSGYLLFSKTITKPSEISVPFNTFSPDNRNIFLKEDNDFIVWNISDSTSTNVSELFSQKLPELKLLDITGWAAPGLLIVNAQDASGEKRSYWFEVSSQIFIQLATGFY